MQINKNKVALVAVGVVLAYFVASEALSGIITGLLGSVLGSIVAWFVIVPRVEAWGRKKFFDGFSSAAFYAAAVCSAAVGAATAMTIAEDVIEVVTPDAIEAKFWFVPSFDLFSGMSGAFLSFLGTVVFDCVMVHRAGEVPHAKPSSS